jgi:hypothetical protein
MKTLLPRMSATLAGAILLFLVIAYIAPQQLPVTIYKLSLITIAAVIGYWIDRELFPYARPDGFIDTSPDGSPDPELDETDHALLLIDPGAQNLARLFAAAQLRRALVVSACVIAVALGA